MTDEDLGPLLVAPASYLEVRKLLRTALGFPERRPLLIGIDGVDGSGKSSLAAWLSWQLEMPAIHLDIYMIRDSEPLQWRLSDLGRAIDAAQLEMQRPVIVEGVCLLHVLNGIDRTPNYLIFVERQKHENNMRERMDTYFNEWTPKARANHVLDWTSAEYDSSVIQAHLKHLERE